MPRNIPWGEPEQKNALNLVEALLRYADEELELDDALKTAVQVEWVSDNQLRVTGKRKQKSGNRIVEVGTRKEHLATLMQKTGKCLELRKREGSQQDKALDAIQTVIDCLRELEILKEDPNQKKNQGYWKFTLALQHQTASREENLVLVKQKWQKKTVLKIPESSPIPDKNIDWRNVCLAVLEAEEQQKLTTNQLMRDEDEYFDIDEIHVPLALIERKKPDKRGADILPEQGSQLYEPEYEEKQRFEHKQFLQDVLKDGKGKSNGQRIAIIGEPGAGKTTLLRKIAFWVQENTIFFPILISLADLPETNSKQEFLEQYLLDKWFKAALPYISPETVEVTEALKTQLKQLCNQRQVCLLLDGVDEMPVHGEEPLWAISNQLKGWVGQARVVLTCRLNVWEANRNVRADNFEVYRTLEFSYGDSITPDKVGEFIGKWFQRQPNLGQQLRQALDEPGKERIKDLVKNPLRLALLCSTWNLWREHGGLPDTKAKLYQGFLEKFYEWKSKEFPTTSSQQEQLNRALGELAKRAIDQPSSRFRLKHSLVCEVLGKPDEGLFRLVLQLGWLNKVGLAAESPNETVYAFWHTTFEEYFAAVAVNDWHFFLNHVPQNPKQGIYRIYEKQWKEVILLWLGRTDVEKEQKEEFIKAMVEFQDECQDFYKKRAYFLAAQGIAELGNFDLSNNIVEQLVAWSFDNSNLLSVEARKTLEQTHRQKAITVLQKFLYDSKNESISVEVAYTLGKLDQKNKVAINYLKNLLKACDNELLLKVAYSLEKIDKGNLDAIATLFKLLKNSENREIYNSAAYTLEKLCKYSATVIKKLKQLLCNENKKIRNRAIDILWNLDKSDPDIIDFWIKRLDNSKYNHVRSVIARNLGEVNTLNKDVINILNKLLDSRESEATRICAAESLSNFKPSQPENPIAVLKEIISNSQDYLKICWAARVLGKFDDAKQDAIEILKSLLHNKHPQVRRWATDNLGELDKGNPDAIANSIELLLTCQDHEEIQQIVYVLERIGQENPLVIDALLQVMHKRGNDQGVVLLAASSLLKLAPSNQDAINPLTKILNTCEDQFMQWRIADTLLQLDNNNKNAIEVLIKLLHTCRDESLIIDTIITLGKIIKHKPNVADTLVDLVSNTDNENIFLVASSFLRSIKDFNSLKNIVFKLKATLTEQIYKKQHKLYNECYKLLWHCAQNLPYPDFYQAWHQDTLTNTATANLNIAKFPQAIAEAINNQPELCSKVKLICIDTHQFIDPENPAPEIYDQMLNQNCPEWQNGYPDTMQKLKLYWNYLRRNSEIPLFFICYDSTALTATPTGFSLPFLTALSKFDGAICVVTSPPNPLSCEARGSKNNSSDSVAGEAMRGWVSLQRFSPSQPNLVADVVAWIRQSLLENRQRI